MATYTYEDIRDLEGETLVGDTFDFHRPVGFYRTSTLRDITFINCTFEGDLETIDFEDCSVKKCTFNHIRHPWIRAEYSNFDNCTFLARNTLFGLEAKSSNFRKCDFTEIMVVRLDLSDSDLTECEFPINTSLEEGSFESLSGTSGIPVEETDRSGNRRRDLSDNLLSVEELAAKKAESKIKKLEVRVDRAKGDKELETLAKEVGKLQAQPEFKDYHKHQLLDLRDRIEGKYSVVGKGLRYLRRLFKKGHRASQIRVASQMNRELQREIRELKRDLRK